MGSMRDMPCLLGIAERNVEGGTFPSSKRSAPWITSSSTSTRTCGSRSSRPLPGHTERAALDLRRLGGPSAKIAADRFADELPLLVDDDRRMAAMTAAGVDAQVVSVTPTQYHHWVADPGIARDLACPHPRSRRRTLCPSP